VQVTLTGVQRDTLREVLVEEMKFLGAVNLKPETLNAKPETRSSEAPNFKPHTPHPKLVYDLVG